MSVHPRLSINQATITHTTVAEALRVTADAGIGAIGLWREQVQDAGLAEAARMLADSGLRYSTHCRGGWFTAVEGPDRRAAIDDNRRAIERPRRSPPRVPRARVPCLCWWSAVCRSGRATFPARASACATRWPSSPPTRRPRE